MRPIQIAHLDKARPVLVLTREIIRPALSSVTVAPITTRVRGIRTEVTVGQANGLDQDCVVSLDNVQTIPVKQLGKVVGYLLPQQERGLAEAIRAAYNLAAD